LHQGATTNAQAAVALGHLLNEMLGGGAPNALHTLATQAMAGEFATVDAFMATLRRVRQQYGAPTMVMPPMVPQTIDLGQPTVPQTMDLAQPAEREPIERAVGTPTVRQVTYSVPPLSRQRSPTGAQRRVPTAIPPRPGTRPGTHTARGGRSLVWALLGTIALIAAAFWVLPRLGGLFGDDATAAVGTTPTARVGNASPSVRPSAAAVVPSTSPSAAVSPSTAASASPSPSASPAPSGEQYVVASSTGENLRVRAGPGLSAQLITALPNGTAVQVIGAGQPQDNYTWVQIRANGVEGWCILEGLTRQTAAASSAPSASPSASSPSTAASSSPQPSPTPSPAPPSASPALSGGGPRYVVATNTGENLVVRAGPGTATQRVTSLPNGTVVEAIGAAQQAEGSTWLPIRAGDVQGWVIAGAVRQQ